MIFDPFPLLPEGASFDDALRKAIFDNRNISPGLKAELKQAQADLRAADQLYDDIRAKQKQRMADKLRQEQQRKREQRLAKIRREIKARNEKYKAMAIEIEKSWRQCIFKLGLNPDESDQWRAWPESC